MKAIDGIENRMTLDQLARGQISCAETADVFLPRLRRNTHAATKSRHETTLHLCPLELSQIFNYGYPAIEKRVDC